MTHMRRAPARRQPVTFQALTHLEVNTSGRGFFEITAEVAAFLAEAGAATGTLTAFCRHTSASLTIQENADPDVRADLITALETLAPTGFGWVHDLEGPDDMPAHVRTMLTDVTVTIPVEDGRLGLGAWQGLYLIEHRTKPHRREIRLIFTGTGVE